MSRALVAAALLLALPTPRAVAAGSMPDRQAAATLTRAAQAYEAGDLAAVIEAARPVAEGAFPDATTNERIEALRFLGIGLFLDGRPDGAETAFVKLLALRPDAELDPKRTRADAIAFFEDVKRRNPPPKTLAWNLLPPAGQIQNGDVGRAWIIGGVEVAALATAVGAGWWLNANVQMPGYTFKDKEKADFIKTVQFTSWGVLAATYVFGVVDGLVRSDRRDDREARATLTLLPNGAALHVRF